jgi:gas vesicle protein
MSDTANDIGTFFAGLMIGGLVGAAVALLLAPQSGEETRVIIKDKSIELKDKAVESGAGARTAAEKALEDARVTADAAIADLRTRTDELAAIAKERAAQLQGAAPAEEVIEDVEVPLDDEAAEAPAA